MALLNGTAGAVFHLFVKIMIGTRFRKLEKSQTSDSLL